MVSLHENNKGNIMRTSVVATLALSALSGTAVHAAESPYPSQYYSPKYTISAGYAASDIEDGDLGIGVNLKFRTEFNKEYGIIASATYTTLNQSGYSSGIYYSEDLDYASFLFGPTLRANQYFTVYFLAGFANASLDGDYSVSGNFVSGSTSKTKFAYGAGIQINLTKNLTIDSSYEHSEFWDVGVGTWSISGGYRF